MNSTQVGIMQRMVRTNRVKGGDGQINGLQLSKAAGLNISERTELARRVIQNPFLTAAQAYKTLEKYSVLPEDIYAGYTYPRWDRGTGGE